MLIILGVILFFLALLIGAWYKPWLQPWWPRNLSRRFRRTRVYHGGSGRSSRGLHHGKPIFRKSTNRVRDSFEMELFEGKQLDTGNSDATFDITLWPQLRTLPADFLRNVDRFFVASCPTRGKPPVESVFLWTFDNRLFVYGANQCGILGLGHANPVKLTNGEYPPEQPTLTGKPIVQMSYSGKGHIAALEENGNLYTWGKNSQGQLGIGNFVCAYLPQLVCRNVREVACGFTFTVLLDFDGKCLVSGRIDKDQSRKVEYPIFVNSHLKDIHKIQCCNQNLLAIDSQGQCYTNRVCEKSKSLFESLYMPDLIKNGVTAIAQGSEYLYVACGPNGLLYSVSLYELEDKICLPVKNVIQIITQHHSEMVILRLDNGTYKVLRDNQLMNSATESIPECFALYGRSSSTPCIVRTSKLDIEANLSINNPLGGIEIKVDDGFRSLFVDFYTLPKNSCFVNYLDNSSMQLKFRRFRYFSIYYLVLSLIENRMQMLDLDHLVEIYIVAHELKEMKVTEMCIYPLVCEIVKQFGAYQKPDCFNYTLAEKLEKIIRNVCTYRRIIKPIPMSCNSIGSPIEGVFRFVILDSIQDYFQNSLSSFSIKQKLDRSGNFPFTLEYLALQKPDSLAWIYILRHSNTDEC